MNNADIKNNKAIFLVENGFCEREYTQAQNALKSLDLDCRLASDKNMLPRGWNERKISSDSAWGNRYASDILLKNALPSDYDILVIPGGIRSIEKLKLGHDIKSFVSAFIQTGKPVIAYNHAIELLSYLDLVSGYSLAATNLICDSAKNSGGVCAAPEFIVSRNLITLSRFRDVGEKIQFAVQCILNGERYTDKIVSSDNMPHPYKAA